ncbi:hypothetical protein JTB14_037968 [Gonioctena quinquepunctata]|nr:hypothetical protein JTB14_037968 [Gonioctena quinquepunctata]
MLLPPRSAPTAAPDGLTASPSALTTATLLLVKASWSTARMLTNHMPLTVDYKHDASASSIFRASNFCRTWKSCSLSSKKLSQKKLNENDLAKDSKRERSLQLTTDLSLTTTECKVMTTLSDPKNRFMFAFPSYKKQLEGNQ